jgi:F0F1-type ATP synthase alpha subunit
LQKRVKYKTKFDQNTNLYSLIKDLVVGKYVGFVSTVGDGVVKATGLRGVAYGEVVYFPSSNIRGLAYNLNKDDVDILVLGEDRNIKTGDLILATKSGLYVPVSKKLLGRIISPLGEVLDDKDKISEISAYANINMKAPGIIYRQKINEPLFTGIKVLDSLIPIGKGQRELIIGDKGTGKTSLAFDIILNQKFENEKDFSNLVLCIYVSIGQKRSNVKKFFENLEKFDAS